MSATRFILARHAESVWHETNRYAGSSDVPLSRRGVREAEEFGHIMHAVALDAVVCSDLRRAVDTARPVCRDRAVVLRSDARLREVDFGRGEGRTRAEMAGLFPDALEAFLARPATVALPGGERGVAALSRALPFFEELAAEEFAGSVLVVCHSTLIRLLLCHFIGVDPDRYRSLFPQMRTCGVTVLELDETGAAHLLGFNARRP